MTLMGQIRAWVVIEPVARVCCINIDYDPFSILTNFLTLYHVKSR